MMMMTMIMMMMMMTTFYFNLDLSVICICNLCSGLVKVYLTGSIVTARGKEMGGG